MASVDPLDPWDPLDWLAPLASLDVRYDCTNIPGTETMPFHILCPRQVNFELFTNVSALSFREALETRDQLDVTDLPDPR